MALKRKRVPSRYDGTATSHGYSLIQDYRSRTRYRTPFHHALEEALVDVGETHVAYRGLVAAAERIVELAGEVVDEQSDMLDSNLFEAMAQPLAPFARIACGRVGPLLGVPILVRFDLREPPLDAIAAPALLPEPFEFVIDTLALAFVGALPPR